MHLHSRVRYAAGAWRSFSGPFQMLPACATLSWAKCAALAASSPDAGSWSGWCIPLHSTCISLLLLLHRSCTAPLPAARLPTLPAPTPHCSLRSPPELRYAQACLKRSEDCLPPCALTPSSTPHIPTHQHRCPPALHASAVPSLPTRRPQSGMRYAPESPPRCRCRTTVLFMPLRSST
jgi:hypothetical protein